MWVQTLLSIHFLFLVQIKKQTKKETNKQIKTYLNMVSLENPANYRQGQSALVNNTVKTKEKMLVPGS